MTDNAPHIPKLWEHKSDGRRAVVRRVSVLWVWADDESDDPEWEYLDEFEEAFDVVTSQRPRMTPGDFRARMEAIVEGPGDTEQMHMRADELLMEVLRALGYGDGVDVFDATPRWYA